MLSFNQTSQNFRYFIEYIVCVCDMKDFYGLFVFLIFTDVYFYWLHSNYYEVTLFEKALQNKLHTCLYLRMKNEKLTYFEIASH